MSVRGVGFDLDYTLVVPERDRAELLSEALNRVGAPMVDREEYLAAHREYMTSETREPIFAEVLAGYDTSVSPEAVTQAYREVVNEALVPVDGAFSLLMELKTDYRVGVLTNGPSVAQREKLAVLGWEEVFDTVVIAGDMAAGKPTRSAFVELLNGLGIEASELVFVGDEIETDIDGAVEAGIRVIQVCYPGGPEPDPRAIGHVNRADLRGDLPELLSMLSTA